MAWRSAASSSSSVSRDEISRSRGAQVEVPVQLTQGQIASMTGSCQQTVSEALAALERQGLIAFSRKRLTLLASQAILDRPHSLAG